MASFDSQELRQAFGQFMTGVTVVTSMTNEKVPVGFTANSYTSVSLDPPLLLVCLANTLGCFPVFERCSHFVVNVLTEDQRNVSNVFATSSDDRFAHVDWHSDDNGCPIITDSLVAFSCTAYQRIDAGDHVILIGQIEDLQTHVAAGLGYCNTGYFSLGRERQVQEPPSAEHALITGAIVEHKGRILMCETEYGLHPPHVGISSKTGSLSAVRALFRGADLAVSLGPVYSIFEDQKTGEIFNYYKGIIDSDEQTELGIFVSIDDLADANFISTAHEKMIKRYILERESGPFSLYSGDNSG